MGTEIKMRIILRLSRVLPINHKILYVFAHLGRWRERVEDKVQIPRRKKLEMKKFLLSITTFLVGALLALPAFAQEGEHGGASGWVALAAGLCMGIGTLGGALGQSRAAAAALEGIARNPQAAAKIQTPMIIALAMMESLVLFALVIAFLLQGKA